MCSGLFAVVAVPASQITEEVVEEELQPPPTRKRRLEPAANHTEPKDKVSVVCSKQAGPGSKLSEA